MHILLLLLCRPPGASMAAEVKEDLNKAQKRELKWERKQAKVKAAAEATGQTYVPPPKEDKNRPTDKMGKRKKRKLAALQLNEGADAITPTSSKSPDTKPNDSKQQPELANGSTVGQADGIADQSKAEKKAAKKAKKATLADAIGTTAAKPVIAAAEAPSTGNLKKKNKKSTESSISTDAAQPSDTQPASPPSKKQKKAAASAVPSPTPQGRVRAHQQAVLASVGDQELAKSGKAILKDLYQEHPSVTGMTTEEVTKHRADRDTAVTGIDLRPVLQFEQAGSKLPSSSQSCAIQCVFTVYMVAVHLSSTLLQHCLAIHDVTDVRLTSVYYMFCEPCRCCCSLAIQIFSGPGPGAIRDIIACMPCMSIVSILPPWQIKICA